MIYILKTLKNHQWKNRNLQFCSCSEVYLLEFQLNGFKQGKSGCSDEAFKVMEAEVSPCNARQPTGERKD